MDKYQRLGLRLSIAVSLGVLVAAIACLVAWRNIGDMTNFWPEEMATRATLDILDEQIRTYKREGMPLPTSLRNLRDAAYLPVQFDENGSPLDGWGHPFIYTVADANYVIWSYGRDGKPGGIGTDRDLSNLMQLPGRTCPTFTQFLFNSWARGVIITCLACGVIAFLLSVAAVNFSALHGQAIPVLIVELAGTVLGALAAAFIMSIFHIPNHH